MKAAELNVWMSVKLWVTDIQSLTKKNNALCLVLASPRNISVFLRKEKKLGFVHVLHLSDVSFTKLLGSEMVGKEACGLWFVKEDGWTVIVGQWLDCLYKLTDENIFLFNFGFPYNLSGFLHLDFLLWIFSEISFSDFISFFPSHSKSGCCSTVRETNSTPTSCD